MNHDGAMHRNDLGTTFAIDDTDRDTIADVVGIWA